MEYVDIVDENDNVIGKDSRDEADNKELRRRVSRVNVFDKAGRLLMNKRASTVQASPGMWEIGIGETLKSGEDYEHAAKRGLKEELGIENYELKYLGKKLYKDGDIERFFGVFNAVTVEEISLSEENADFEYIELKELGKVMEQKKFTHWSYWLLKWLKQ